MVLQLICSNNTTAITIITTTSQYIEHNYGIQYIDKYYNYCSNKIDTVSLGVVFLTATALFIIYCTVLGVRYGRVAC